jgi:hypothetical protein
VHERDTGTGEGEDEGVKLPLHIFLIMKNPIIR